MVLARVLSFPLAFSPSSPAWRKLAGSELLRRLRQDRCCMIQNPVLPRRPSIRHGGARANMAFATSTSPSIFHLPQIPAPVTDQSCAATSSANTLIGVGCPHAPPSCANLHSARRSRRHRLPFPAGFFIEGFRTPATVQAASLRSAGIRNPQTITDLRQGPQHRRPRPVLSSSRTHPRHETHRRRHSIKADRPNQRAP
jgi:hypothetical protein